MDHLEQVFVNLTSRNLYDVWHCKYRKYNDLSSGKLQDLFIRQKISLNLPDQIRQEPFLLNKISSLRFKIRPSLIQQAKETLILMKQKISGSIGNSSTNQQKKYTHVGIHVRRTDSTVYASRYIPMDFFMRAMRYYRKRFKHVVFFVVSDDAKWCNKAFAPYKDSFVMTGGDYLEDFVLLTQCQHSIMSYGTFGFWASLIAGGQVVYPSYKRFSNYYGRMANILNKLQKRLGWIPI